MFPITGPVDDLATVRSEYPAIRRGYKSETGTYHFQVQNPSGRKEKFISNLRNLLDELLIENGLTFFV